MTEQMDTIDRHTATAEVIRALEDGDTNPFNGKAWSASHESMLNTRRQLPVSKFSKEILEMYHEQNVFVLSSETGSGKSTQVPQLLAFDEYSSGKQVICTQTRRIAAENLAARVAKEMDVECGQEVGYTIGGSNKSVSPTNAAQFGMPMSRVVFMTEGSLLRKLAYNKSLETVACVIIDDAHERSCDTDLLLMFLKRTLQKRPSGDFKIIIMSATLDAGTFQKYYDDCPLLTVPGQSYDVKVQYLPPGKELVNVYTQAANLAISIHRAQKDKAGILIFAPGKPELRLLHDLLLNNRTDMNVQMLFGGQPSTTQQRIIRQQGTGRKCILATPIAEASLTIDGIAHVIDTGLCKEAVYNPRLALHQLVLKPVSQASANQRKGRAGRTAPGTCYRLYTKAAFEGMKPSTTPSILLSPLHDVILTLDRFGARKVMDLPWVTYPPSEAFMRAAQDLQDWGLKGENGRSTLEGRCASELLIECKWYPSIVAAHKLGCASEMVEIAALCSAEDDIFWRPDDFEIAADESHRMWMADGSDHLARLTAFHAYLVVREKFEDQPHILVQWCGDRLLDIDALEEALTLRKRVAMRLEGHGLITGTHMPQAKIADQYNLLKALAAGFCTQLAICREPKDNIYRTLGSNVEAQPLAHSAAVGHEPEWVVYTTLRRRSGRTILDYVSPISARWLVELPSLSDDRLERNWTGTAFKQPYVKASLDRARAARTVRTALEHMSENEHSAAAAASAPAPAPASRATATQNNNHVGVNASADNTALQQLKSHKPLNLANTPAFKLPEKWRNDRDAAVDTMKTYQDSWKAAQGY